MAHQAAHARNVGMAALWVEPLLEWLSRSGLLGSTTRVLDYGCGYFDVGLRLSGRVARVDGFDPDPQALALAHDRIAQAGGLQLSRLVEHVDALDPESYDLIVVNSVLQYLPDFAAVDAFLAGCARWLPRAAGHVVLSDLIPPDYSAPLDAVDSLVHAARHGHARAMVAHLWQAATKPSGLALLHIDPRQLQAAAARHGFVVQRLPRNLTPSRRRYSVVLSRV